MPQVSVLMKSYNHERFIAEAIESVLRQSFDDFELLIVDDASTDRSQA
ncbi:MAG: glycosyltransferase family 2 protein, partial [Halobacteriota archaeon]